MSIISINKLLEIVKEMKESEWKRLKRNKKRSEDF